MHKCPYCKKDITDELNDMFFFDYIYDFETMYIDHNETFSDMCPYCDEVIDIFVRVQPIFKITK